MGLFFFFLTSVQARAQSPEKMQEHPNLIIVSSILPVHSLVSAITHDVPGVQTRLLLNGAASPHTFVLRPSDRRLLQSADLIFWIGPTLEAFLPSILSRLPDKTMAIALIDSPDIKVLPTRTNAIWQEADEEEHEHNHDHGHAHDHVHVAGEPDPHIWLSVPNAMKMALMIQNTLIQKDPVHRLTYEKNGEILQKKLKALDQTLKKSLKLYQNRAFFVFHDGYQYLEKTYGLKKVIVVTIHPELPFTISQKRYLEKMVSETGATCAFSEPQFGTEKMQQLLGPASSSLKWGVLDPLGDSKGEPRHAYFQTLTDLIEVIKKCLKSD